MEVHVEDIEEDGQIGIRIDGPEGTLDTNLLRRLCMEMEGLNTANYRGIDSIIFDNPDEGIPGEPNIRRLVAAVYLREQA